MNEDLPYLIGFSHFLGIGPVRFTALLKAFGDIKKAYLAEENEIGRVIGLKRAAKFSQFRRQFDPVKKLEELEKKNILPVSCLDRLYPRQLANIEDSPICIYIKGNLNCINFAQDYFFAVVGTRKATSYGIQVASRFASELAKAGFVIVSGMAFGIDTAAHWSAINSGGKTVVVLGCGVDIIYPAANRKLYERIIQSAGLVISEFPPGQLVEKGLFIERNRIISALAKGVLVVEGAEDSGALITARYAAAQGKEVFAPPGPITSVMSEAPNTLLKEGAKLVTSLNDILEEFNLKISPRKKEVVERDLDEEERIVFMVLRKEAVLSDEIVSLTDMPIEKVLTILSHLEIRGIVEKNPEGKYQVKI